MSAEPTKHVRTKMVYIVPALALILGLAAVAVGYVALTQNSPNPENPTMGALSGIRETKVTTIISSTVNQTSTLVYEDSNWTATYEPGKNFTISESLYTASSTGVAVLTSVVSNTMGFVFETSEPSLPALVPYAANVTEATQKIQLTFQAPSENYSGPFEYTVYFTLTVP